MSHPLQLDTQMVQSHNRRYSFIETPLEMHSSVQPDLASSPPVPNNPSIPPQHPAFEHRSPSREQISPYVAPAHSHAAPQQTSLGHPAHLEGQTAQYIPSEKERELQQEGIIPTYSKYPPPEQHPANFAPFADTPARQPTIQSPTYSYSQLPNSPGPLPLKTHTEAPARTDTISVAPDANPLQSPKSPYFPPPTMATTPHAPPVEDLRTFHQPGQIMHPNQEVQGGTWSHGICECSSPGICCLGLTCPCILFGRTQYRLAMRSKKQDPTNMLGHDTCNGSCTAFALLCGFQWLWATIQHTRTRKAYGIQGDIASDCVRATCCTCCTLIQDEKEIQKREEQRSRAALERGATLLSPYTAPGPLAYPPPPK